MSLLNRSGQQYPSDNNDRQQVKRAREEAEALFRSKQRFDDPPRPPDPPSASSPRKPRVLSAYAPTVGPRNAEALASSEPQMRPASTSQFARIQQERERLIRCRALIFHQQHELQAKLDAINSEIRGIDAYEVAKNGKPSPRPRCSGGG
jgi:hypothetical protein